LASSAQFLNRDLAIFRDALRKGSDTVAAAQRTIFRRDQFVAAGLVGMVVILVAFASGIGMDKSVHTTAVPDQHAESAVPLPGSPTVAPATAEPTQPGATALPYVPVRYEGTPAPGSTPATPPATGSPVPTRTSAPAPSASTPTPSRSPSPTSSPPACTPALLQSLIVQLSSVASNLPVLSPLLDRLALDPTGGLPVMGGLLTVPSPTSTAPTSVLTGMTGPCTGVLTSLLSGS
jgi:hypothetical protein